MSVDKEPVPTDTTKVDPAPPVPPQQLPACPGSFNNAPKVPETALDNSIITDVVATCPMPDSGAQTKPSSLTHRTNLQEKVGQQAMVTEHNLNHKNGLQQPKQQQQQQQQQQKLSKRRSTMNAGFKHPTGKRRRRANSESDSVLPSNFLLGGNIFDPLNLNSLLDEDVNRALNAETPRSSPLPAKNRDPVEILIPRDITDPLNLNSEMDGRCVLVSPLKSGGRRRHRHRHHGGGGGGGGGVGATSITGLDLSDSEKGAEVPAAAPGSSQTNLPPASVAAASVLEVASVSAAVDPRGGNEVDQTHNQDETALPISAPQPRAPADSSAGAPVGPNQLNSRQRKRRRNSSKTEAPAAQSTPAARNVQSSFHTPVVGPSGLSQIPARQLALNQHKKQPQQHNKKKFLYGNYNKYYGYRNPGCGDDPRLRFLRREWFQGKAVLDLGCNTGHLTLCIAKKLQPARILGLDIDGGLVHVARQNIRHYESEVLVWESRKTTGEEKKTDEPVEEEMEVKNEESSHPVEQTHVPEEPGGMESTRAENGDEEKPVRDSVVPGLAGDGVVMSRHTEKRAQETEEGDDPAEPAVEMGTSTFPVSLRITRGPIAAPSLPHTPSMPPGRFPSNVSFAKANYVLESDALLLTQRAEYDVILCFSVTKWVHLNWGDCGLKRLFHRVFRHLRPGGLFILEPQPWVTYGKRKRLTENIYKNYQSIQLKPEGFSTYLTSEVGFCSYELIGLPNNLSKGFQRPIYLFRKGT
ncbi:hypothetical protein DPEC_G00239380 [Dallia pectoralis]|uniref:Uncharacterized protein n=1 Tax=Dallia pectoralis TaxID=75939 RepID=A0ACC2FZ35_DALPE|nr:hypothetical protein DPEC_G00239380 [Dallia pectoralis]